MASRTYNTMRAIPRACINTGLGASHKKFPRFLAQLLPLFFPGKKYPPLLSSFFQSSLVHLSSSHSQGLSGVLLPLFFIPDKRKILLYLLPIYRGLVEYCCHCFLSQNTRNILFLFPIFPFPIYRYLVSTAALVFYPL